MQEVATVRLKKYGPQKKVKVLSKTFLERRSVQEPVEREYLNRYTAFLAWCRAARLPCSSVTEIDEALTMQMHENFFDGAPGTDGKKQLAAHGYWTPFLKRGSPELTRSHAAAAGWRKLSPAFSRLPSPLIVAFMIFN